MNVARSLKLNQREDERSQAQNAIVWRLRLFKHCCHRTAVRRYTIQCSLQVTMCVCRLGRRWLATRARLSSSSVRASVRGIVRRPRLHSVPPHLRRAILFYHRRDLQYTIFQTDFHKMCSKMSAFFSNFSQSENEKKTERKRRTDRFQLHGPRSQFQSCAVSRWGADGIFSHLSEM